MKKTPGFKKVIGQRVMDDDGFTYRYGKGKGGFIKQSRHTNGIDRCKRASKKKMKNIDNIILKKDGENENGNT